MDLEAQIIRTLHKYKLTYENKYILNGYDKGAKMNLATALKRELAGL